MARKTVIFSSTMTALPSGMSVIGLRNFLPSFTWAGIIVPRTADGFLLLDDPRHNGGTRQFAGAPIVAEIDHRNGLVTKAIDGTQLTWDNVSIAAGETVNFDFVFIDGEVQRMPAATYNDFWQFEALLAGTGANVLGQKTEYHSRMKGDGASIRGGRYVWLSRSYPFTAAFNGSLRWTVANGQQIRKGTRLNANASQYPSALALDFVSIT